MINTCCKKEQEPIINKGSQCTITVKGNITTLNPECIYKGVLYADARNIKNVATTIAKVEIIDNIAILIFTFAKEETIKLKNGKNIFEFYNTEDNSIIGYKEDITVRPTSIKI